MGMKGMGEARDIHPSRVQRHKNEGGGVGVARWRWERRQSEDSLHVWGSMAWSRRGHRTLLHSNITIWGLGQEIEVGGVCYV